MHINTFEQKISHYAARGEAFIFIIDFECKSPFVCPLHEAESHGIFYDIKGVSNIETKTINKDIKLQATPVPNSIYTGIYRQIIKHIQDGDSYLLNLTFPSKITTNLSLEDVFHMAQAKYKLLFNNEFVVFSPECFIKIGNDKVNAYPMKGTIDAGIAGAEDILLNDKKEQWEHNTIVDLLRNDLSMIASDVSVTKYRYVEKIKTNRTDILQTSSEIQGQLPKTWQKDLGSTILKLLPAGSISGAPKQKTVEIIKDQELDNRGYYTGVFGIFDGRNLDSAVAIRFIEQKGDNMFYRSGGGITAQSNVVNEYEELTQKIYVPTL